jgi:hypothetical protein
MNDTTDEEIRSSLRPAAMSSVMTPVSSSIDPSAWRVAYLVLTELDLGMPAALQSYLIDRAKKAGAEVDDSQKLRSGHFVQWTHPDKVADWVLRLL